MEGLFTRMGHPIPSPFGGRMVSTTNCGVRPNHSFNRTRREAASFPVAWRWGQALNSDVGRHGRAYEKRNP
jgi:hypothetical protein